MRVERTVCCGLCSTDPATRQKFFRLHTDRIPRELFDRLRFIIQYQDWEFLAHTFWLKHAVVSCTESPPTVAITEELTTYHTAFHLFAGYLVRLPAYARSHHAGVQLGACSTSLQLQGVAQLPRWRAPWEHQTRGAAYNDSRWHRWHRRGNRGHRWCTRAFTSRKRCGCDTSWRCRHGRAAHHCPFRAHRRSASSGIWQLSRNAHHEFCQGIPSAGHPFT